MYVYTRTFLVNGKTKILLEFWQLIPSLFCGNFLMGAISLSYSGEQAAAGLCMSRAWVGFQNLFVHRYYRWHKVSISQTHITKNE